ncbi:hypothetical protein N9P55_00035 [bacterium]|nr:hypothetical protein [bacterium]MDB4088260.1 hypothetical protein [Flavobacteriales bacterium]
MIISGIRSPKIGEIKIIDTICETCGKQTTNNITVFGRYVHVFWIPTFPAGRVVVTECEDCQFTYKKKKFPPQLKRRYEQHKKQVKRPIWHWSGTILITLLVAWFSYAVSNAKVDPRSHLLQADLDSMVSNPTLETDSISFALKDILDEFVVDELQPHNFEYFSREDVNKALILVKIPRLRKVKKEDRFDLLDLIGNVIGALPNLENKEIYIGVEGRISIMLIDTPTAEKNGRFVSESPLYEFYGKILEGNELEE